MNECDRFRDSLIDYADGVADGDDKTRLERHLAECGACRAEADALRRSLCVAQSVWDEAVAAQRRGVPVVRGRRRAWQAAAALAGAAALVAIAIGIARPRPQAADPAPDDATVAGSGMEMDELDIEAIIRRSEQSARLAASVRVLASEPLAEQDAERARRYLRTAYGALELSVAEGGSGDL